ncbi:Initiator protein NS1 [Taenia solium]|eukprot:TsM_000996000 transcript=TsM_000996000 gene=TsM_000996000
MFLHNIFRNNRIFLADFLQEVDNIICMKYPRINTLVLRGPTSTGKTLLAKNIVKPYNYGTVSRDDDATAFYLQNLLDHDVALMEEPHISFVKLLQTIQAQRQGELRVQGLQLLKQHFLSALVKGESGRYHLDRDKLPDHKEWEERYEAQHEDYDEAITTLIEDLRKKDLYIYGSWDDKSKEYERQYLEREAE